MPSSRSSVMKLVPLARFTLLFKKTKSEKNDRKSSQRCLPSFTMFVADGSIQGFNKMKLASAIYIYAWVLQITTEIKEPMKHCRNSLIPLTYD